MYLPLVCERVVPHMPLSVFARCHACNLPECAPECGQRIETALLCHLLQCIVGVFLKHGDALLLDSQFVDVVIEALADYLREVAAQVCTVGVQTLGQVVERQTRLQIKSLSLYHFLKRAGKREFPLFVVL